MSFTVAVAGCVCVAKRTNKAEAHTLAAFCRAQPFSMGFIVIFHICISYFPACFASTALDKMRTGTVMFASVCASKRNITTSTLSLSLPLSILFRAVFASLPLKSISIIIFNRILLAKLHAHTNTLWIQVSLSSEQHRTDWNGVANWLCSIEQT